MHRSKKSSIAGEGIASSTLGPKSSGSSERTFHGYSVKRSDISEMTELVRHIENFWLREHRYPNVRTAVN
jgi:hypothetical protein